VEITLSDDQQTQLKRTRETLTLLSMALAEAGAPAADKSTLAESIRRLDELFLLVVAGEFNAGKSAFVNALVGANILPEGVTPTTRQITVLKYGDEAGQRVDSQGVLTITAPVELLRTVNIVDTPGTNAVLREHQEITEEFIPKSDLVLFLTSADRPFSESERLFLEQIKGWGKKIILVVNKIDILADEAAVEEVTKFARESAAKLIGDILALFTTSAKKAQKGKADSPELLPESGFGELESFILRTLEDESRFKLKLLSPLGTAEKLTGDNLAVVEQSLGTLEDDHQILSDIHTQVGVYESDMKRNFQARLGEIDNLLHGMEGRGREFFEEMIRVGRIPDLLKAERLEKKFEADVVADTPEQVEARVSEMVDWIVEQDLRQWTAVSEHLAKRKAEHDERIVGGLNIGSGTLSYDRQRLIDSVGKAAAAAVATYDKKRESEALAVGARDAVAGLALAEVGGIGIGAIVASLATATLWDVTGILAGVAVMALGFLILPARKRKANQELQSKLAEMRRQLLQSLTSQFDRELRRSSQRIEDTVAPYDRFVRSERDKLTTTETNLREVEAHILGLRQELEPTD